MRHVQAPEPWEILGGGTGLAGSVVTVPWSIRSDPRPALRAGLDRDGLPRRRRDHIVIARRDVLYRSRGPRWRVPGKRRRRQ